MSGELCSYESVSGSDAVAMIAGLECRLDLAKIYDEVELTNDVSPG